MLKFRISWVLDLAAWVNRYICCSARDLGCSHRWLVPLVHLLWLMDTDSELVSVCVVCVLRTAARVIYLMLRLLVIFVFSLCGGYTSKNCKVP